MNEMTKHYIPRHAHAKAIAYFCRIHDCKSYPLREVNGMHGGLIRTVDRKRPVTGMRVYFYSSSDGYSRRSSLLQFERTY